MLLGIGLMGSSMGFLGLGKFLTFSCYMFDSLSYDVHESYMFRFDFKSMVLEVGYCLLQKNLDLFQICELLLNFEN